MGLPLTGVPPACAEAGAGNILRAESALFAMLFGSSLTQKSSAFAKDATYVGMPTHKHKSLDGREGSVVQLGRRSVSLRTHHSSSSSSQVPPTVL